MDYDLDEDNIDSTVSLIQDRLGFSFNQKIGGYAVIDGILIRVKDHSPNWSRFQDEIDENGIKKIINITVGNLTEREGKTTLSEFKLANPDVVLKSFHIEIGENIKQFVNGVLKY